MKFIPFLSLFLFVSCATKYIIPGNRFITPETQGGALRGQIELDQTSATMATIDTRNGTVDDGVKYTDSTRTGFLLSNSLFNAFDLVWSHTGSGNSMLGGKLQFVGGARTEGQAGHKAAIAVLLGDNDHETDDSDSVEFSLKGREYLLLYGYRLSPNIFPYTSFSYATYYFDGKINSSNSSINGLNPKFETNARSLSVGLEMSLDVFFAKLESTYQQMTTSDTKDKSRIMFGYSVGLNW